MGDRIKHDSNEGIVFGNARQARCGSFKRFPISKNSRLALRQQVAATISDRVGVKSGKAAERLGAVGQDLMTCFREAQVS